MPEIIVHSAEAALAEIQRQYHQDDPQPVRYGAHVHRIENLGLDTSDDGWCTCCDVYQALRDSTVIAQWPTWHDWEDHGIGKAIQREIL